MCYRPITIKTEQGYMKVPCGKCLECLRQYQNDWSNRMEEEIKACNGKAVFFTLTYDEQNVPKNYLVDSRIYRSESDYGYTTPSGAHKNRHAHVATPPYQVLIDHHIEFDPSAILDFNIQRKSNKEFVEHLKKIYHDYVGMFHDTDYHACDDYRFYSRAGVSESAARTFVEEFAEEVKRSLRQDDEGGRDDILDTLDAIDEATENDPNLYIDHETGEITLPSSMEETAPNSEYRSRPVMVFNSVRKKDVQDWIKRGRITLERKAKKDGTDPIKFKFFITSEYGPRTLRPHYHGILFGVTVDDVRFMFVDWQRHHGVRIQFDNVDLTKGGVAYVSKYCSKGFYEHPLCSKDFYYTRKVESPINGDDESGLVVGKLHEFLCSEYHSKHYERCIDIFGIDEPIVDPTFHLVSNGLGIAFVERAESLYHLKEFDKTVSKVRVTAPSTISVRADYIPKDWRIPEGELFPRGDVDTQVNYELDRYEMMQSPKAKHVFLNLLDNEQRAVLSSNSLTIEDYNEYMRSFYSRFHYTKVVRRHGVEKTFTYSVPEYYRSKILSDALRVAYSAFVQQEYVRVYQEKFQQLRAQYPAGEDYKVDLEVALALEAEERKEMLTRMQKIFDKTKTFYDKSKV